MICYVFLKYFRGYFFLMMIIHVFLFLYSRRLWAGHPSAHRQPVGQLPGIVTRVKPTYLPTSFQLLPLHVGIAGIALNTWEHLHNIGTHRLLVFTRGQFGETSHFFVCLLSLLSLFSSSDLTKNKRGTFDDTSTLLDLCWDFSHHQHT